MEKFHQILLQVWREACRQIEIDRSCANISNLLVSHMPLERVLVRTFDAERLSLETVAIGLARSGEPLPKALTEYSQDQWQRLMSWCEQGETLHRRGDRAEEEVIQLIIPDKTPRDVLVGKLTKEEKPLGVLILLSPPEISFKSIHRQMLDILIEPFTTGLENDMRLHEITVLREAAEADRLSLLKRLSRNSLGDTIVGEQSGLRLVMERVHLVARSNAPVMIFGETGTGKELISREIHRLSPRSGGPFIRVNCGAIPSELIDSQLFGHEKGAFTGAVATHEGWFERANTGTLFLDEIGELPLAGQVRLLRIIQDGWLERVGGKRPIHVDVRIVVATHRNLTELVNEGIFREDLWYRLAVFPILLPSLRDRLEDIPALATHFAERAAIRFGLPLQLPSDSDISLLRSYSWPGNIRELATVIDRAAILGNGGGLKVRNALGWLSTETSPRKKEDADSVIDSDRQFPSLDSAVTRHIERALARTNGRIDGPHGAALLLGLNANTLRARMKKLGIQRNGFR